MPVTTVARNQQRRWADFQNRPPKQDNPLGLRADRAPVVPFEPARVPLPPAPPVPVAAVTNPLANSEDPWERELGAKYEKELSEGLAALSSKHSASLAELIESNSAESTAFEDEISTKYQTLLSEHLAENGQIVGVPEGLEENVPEE